MRYRIRPIAFALALMVSFSIFGHAQTSKAAKNVALKQYCPVAYIAMGKALKGDAKFVSTFKGKKYYLLNADAKKMFDADPEKYLPKYDGYCATGVAMGQKLESDPAIFTIHEGATYLFSSKEAKAEFDKNPEATIAMADKQFAALGKTH